MKKIITFCAALAALLIGLETSAQTNVQLHYDFGRALYHSSELGGKNLTKDSGAPRALFTTTVEHWNGDKYGSNFFFIDLDYGGGLEAGKNGIRGAYWEISREFCFWGDTKLAGLSAHIEYNGGLDRYSGSYSDCWLFGPTYSFHNSDYTFTASVSALYKVIPANAKAVSNFQLTGVWNYHFCNDMFLFSGFVDLWKENRPWQITKTSAKHLNKDGVDDGTDFIFLSEPQFWFNLHAIKGCEDINLSFGTEVEISNNFVGGGFYAIPTLGAKYTF